MRPCPLDGIPVMSMIENYSGAFVSAGYVPYDIFPKTFDFYNESFAFSHNCWGILWAPISGLLMSELIIDGSSSTVDLSPFSLSRFYERENPKTGDKEGICSR